jgi:hypothetical protein
LPEVDVVMHRSPGRPSVPADRLADFVIASLIREGYGAAAPLSPIGGTA